MPRFFIPLLTMMLFALSGTASAQQFDSFRFVSEISPAIAGSVTGIEFFESASGDNDADNPKAALSFLDASGLSTVFDVEFSPSGIIRDGVPIFMSGTTFGNSNAPSLDLEDVQFLVGNLVNPEDPEALLPIHWFRMTLHNGVWSGVFRINDKIYSIDRLQTDNVIEVRTTSSTNELFQPATLARVTALIDEEYVFADSVGDSVGMDNTGHIFALESIHVMDGLTTDTLGIALRLDQLVYQNASALTSSSQPFDLAAGASEWLDNNAEAFGITDNLATFIFRGANTRSPVDGVHIATGIVQDNFVIQGNSIYYQFESAHYFGSLLGLPIEAGTLQQFVADGLHPLPAADWSQSQREFLSANPPPAELTQTLSFDAPIIEITEDPINQIPQDLIDSDLGEGSDNGGLLQSDDSDVVSESGGSGGGSFGTSLLLLWLLSLIPAVRTRFC